MACTGKEYHHWHLVNANARYELSVTGPAGFTAYASFDESGPPGMVLWQDIAPGPHSEVLKGPGGTHIVRIYVLIVSIVPITVRVTAKVLPAGTTESEDYCREITGANGKSEEIAHSISMK
ncbi:MAG: hypothetical protein Q8N51_03315 [Gammaproteobacteria bacterium]|nr:hypothetical protein [Gammaproteobacteria bacterium]